VDRSIDRSGSGASAGIALHHPEGARALNEEFVLGEHLTTALRVRRIRCVVPKVTGTSSVAVKSEFDFEPADPLGDGFFLR
jgi:proline racemase